MKLQTELGSHVTVVRVHFGINTRLKAKDGKYVSCFNPVIRGERERPQAEEGWWGFPYYKIWTSFLEVNIFIYKLNLFLLYANNIFAFSLNLYYEITKIC